MDEETTEDIVGRAPEGRGVALGNLIQLCPEGGSIFSAMSTLYIRTQRTLTSGLLGLFRHWASQTFTLDPFDLLAHLLVLRRFQPDVLPVLVANARCKTSTNGIEHKL